MKQLSDIYSDEHPIAGGNTNYSVKTNSVLVRTTYSLSNEKQIYLIDSLYLTDLMQLMKT